MYDDDGLVICKLCGKSYHFITPNHLKKQHETTTKEYREKFPDVPMAKKGFYNTLKEKKGIKQNIENNNVIIEELDFNENFNETFSDDDESIVKLAKEHKVPVPTKSSDPMDDKIRIIAYLKLSFPKIKDNYMFKKKKPDGTVECQFITDMADPSCKIVFDFPNAFWHNEMIGVSPHVRKQMLKSYGWKIIEIQASMPKVSHVSDKLKN